jgi:ArsR family metal-binding transcriptional regulator
MAEAINNSAHNVMPYAETKARRAWRARRYKTDPAFRAQRKADAMKSRDKRRADLQQFILEYLSSHPCVDCGESDPVVLDFDHVRDEKRMGICLMVNQAYARQVLETEIAKCDVRCANCHRRRTAKEQGSYRYSGG